MRRALWAGGAVLLAALLLSRVFRSPPDPLPGWCARVALRDRETQAACDAMAREMEPWLKRARVARGTLDVAFQVYRHKIEDLAEKADEDLPPPDDPLCREVREAALAWARFEVKSLDVVAGAVEQMNRANPPDEEDVEGTREFLNPLMLERLALRKTLSRALRRLLKERDVKLEDAPKSGS